MGLPAAPTVFVGRETAIDDVLAVLEPVASDAGRTCDRGTASVVVSAVAGLGGIGKTALALHAAHHAYRRGWFTDIAFLDLRGYDPDPVTARQALDILLRTLHVPAEDIPTTEQERAGLLSSVLTALGGEGRRVLIVADNASSSDQLRPLLPAGDRHRLLVTSRHTHPDLGARLIDLATLAPAAGVDLIRVTLETARPGDTRTRDTPRAALGLVAWCGGLPLALRISTAVLVLNPDQTIPSLLDDLATRRSRIDAIDAHAHLTGTQRALRATFDLSHHRLRSRHRRLLHLLAIAPGAHIGLPAATALAARPEREVLAGLRELTRAHLLTHIAGARGGRWTMHDLIRDYNAVAGEVASGRKGRSGTASDGQAVVRLLRHYAAVAGRADRCLRALPGARVPEGFADRAAALAWFDAERDNLLAAVRTHPGAVTAHLAGLLAVYLHERRRFDEAVAAHTRAVDVFRKAGDRLGEGTALGSLGAALRELRRFDEAIVAQTRAIGVFRAIGDQDGEGMALTNLGSALRDRARFDEAADAHTRAVGIYREAGDRRGEGMALNNLGLVLRDVGRHEEAATVHTEAAGLFREAGDPNGEGRALNNLGSALDEAGRFGDAVAAHTRALGVFREAGERYGEGQALNNLGNSLRDVRRFDEAVTAQTEAVEVFHEVGDRHGEGDALTNLGLVLREVGRFDEAATAHAQAVDAYREVGDAGRAQQALDHLEKARDAGLKQTWWRRWLRRRRT